MNAKTIGIVVLILLLIAAVVYFFMAGSDSDQQDQSSTQNSSSSTGKQKKSFDEVFASGSSQTCTFDDPSVSTAGVLYTDGKNKGRVDYSKLPGGGKLGTHMIVNNDNQMMYVWVDGEANGFAKKISSGSTSGSASSGTDTGKQIELNCSSWTYNASKFTPPSNINFVDLNSFGR